MPEPSPERSVSRIANALQCCWGRLGELHHEATYAEVPPKLLAEQHLDIRLIIDHENEQTHARPDLTADAAARGRTIRNSVNAPGCVSTSIDPPCCLTMMS